jgi:E3 ubiquitin-protein ligase HUWE1
MSVTHHSTVLASELAIANQRFRNLVTLHIRITLLSDVFATARAAHRLIQTLMTSTPLQVLTNLGALHRASMWENIALIVGLSSKGIEVQASPSSSPLEGSPNRTIMDLPDPEASVTANGASGSNGMNSAPALNSSENNGATKLDGPRDWNANSLKHITQGLPNALAPFFQGTNSMASNGFVC